MIARRIAAALVVVLLVTVASLSRAGGGTLASPVPPYVRPADGQAGGSHAASPTAKGINTQALLHDTRSLTYRNPFGAVPMGTKVTLRLRTAHNGVSSVTLETSFTDPSAKSGAGPKAAVKRVKTSSKYDTWQVQLTPSRIGVSGERAVMRA